MRSQQGTLSLTRRTRLSASQPTTLPLVRPQHSIPVEDQPLPADSAPTLLAPEANTLAELDLLSSERVLSHFDRPPTLERKPTLRIERPPSLKSMEENYKNECVNNGLDCVD